MKRDQKVLSGLFFVSGLLHFAKPKVFEKIVPPKLPYARELVYASGAVELASAALLVHPSTRRTGGWIAAGLLVAVFPANLQMADVALKSGRAPAWYKAGVLARLPLQVPMIRIALKAARS